MVSNPPTVCATQILKSYQETKENILSTLQTTVKQLQCYSSLHSPDDALTIELKEVYQLCDALDKLLFHGLREYQRGYWPFVRDFTHSNSIASILKLKNALSDVQRGRAWLCLALNECSLESYFQSFLQNPLLMKKFYVSAAALLDNQHMQVVLMLLAGLENVPISFPLYEVCWGTGLSFCSEVQKSLNRTPSSCSRDFAQHQEQELPTSFQDSDSGVIECDNCPCNTPPPDAILFTSNDTMVSNHVVYSLPSQEFERITKYINIELDSEKSSGSDNIEVTRTKILRRVKKQNGNKSKSDLLKTEPKQDFNEMMLPICNEASEEIDKENRLSKATTDSGLSLEANSSPECGTPELTKALSFDIGDIQQELDVVFTTPEIQYPTVNEDGLISEERGVPEGEEAPITVTHSPKVKKDRPTLLCGNDGDSSVDDEEELSIYDRYPMVIKSKVGEDEEYCHNTNDEEELEDEVPKPYNAPLKVDGAEKTVEKEVLTKQKVIDPVAEELLELSHLIVEEKLDLQLDHNTSLYLLVEIFESDDENYYKMFHGYLNFPKGKADIVFFLLTDKSVYILKPGSTEDQKFLFCDSFLYRNINYITVSLNYQAFTLVSKKQRLSLYTAQEDMTRCILSSLEVAIRRCLPKIAVPNVHTDAFSQLKNLKKFLAGQFVCPQSDVVVHHFALARWEDYVGSHSPVSPDGPVQQGFLMYRQHFCDNNTTELPWSPGYFRLKGCVLYCMADERNSSPLFFIHMFAPHCRGCRRLHLPKRPYAFEVILSNGDTLQLAAANESDASTWQQAFLQAVSLAGHFIDTDERKLIPCCIIVSNHHLIAAKEISGGYVKVLGSSTITDLVSVCADPSVTTCLLMEFDLVEAGRSCGEWILVFDSENEKDKFLDVVQWSWSSHFQIELQISPIKDLSLVRKLQQIAQRISAEKQKLQDICYDTS